VSEPGPGWYPDPNPAAPEDQRRYWNGKRWLDETAGPARTPSPNDAPQGLVIAGYATAVLLPIVGFFVGLALIIKNRAGHGVAVMVISVIVFLIALNAFSGPSYEDCIAGLPVEQWPTCD